MLELKKKEALTYFLCAGLAKCLATFFTYPYQVIRTNMHVFIIILINLPILVENILF